MSMDEKIATNKLLVDKINFSKQVCEHHHSNAFLEFMNRQNISYFHWKLKIQKRYGY